MTQKILHIITGSVAAYKALELIRLLRKRGDAVTGILTAGGEAFITPLAVSSISGTPTYRDLFSLKDEVEMGHIRLAREHDLILIAPASADFIAKMAAGRADDLATATLLASDIPVYLAPAMNHRMWQHPATQRNLSSLQADGIHIIPPQEGEMACGEFGMGRLAELEVILHALGNRPAPVTPKPAAAPASAPASATPVPAANLTEPRIISNERPLMGRRAIVTSGPTQEAIDPVRFISNHSSGKQGYAIASALAEAGADVLLISGPVSLAAPEGVKLIPVHTAQQMYKETLKQLPADIVVCAAAVADWTVLSPASEKIKKTSGKNAPLLSFAQTPDILSAIAQHPSKRPPLVIGFAAETQELEANARKKLKQKKCDWLLANNVAEQEIFGADTTRLLLVTNKGSEDWGNTTKEEAAMRLTHAIVTFFADQVKRDKSSKNSHQAVVDALPNNSMRARYLFSVGISKADIARQLGINYAHVVSALKPSEQKQKLFDLELALARKASVREKVIFLSEEGFTPGKISKKLGMNLSKVKTVLQHKKTAEETSLSRPVSLAMVTKIKNDPSFPTQAARIRYMAKLGMSRAEIAQALGIRYQTVRNTLMPPVRNAFKKKPEKSEKNVK